MDYKELIGKKVLFRTYPFSAVKEGKVLLVSPNEEYIKIEYSNTLHMEWIESDKFRLLDVLE